MGLSFQLDGNAAIATFPFRQSYISFSKRFNHVALGAALSFFSGYTLGVCAVIPFKMAEKLASLSSFCLHGQYSSVNESWNFRLNS